MKPCSDIPPPQVRITRDLKAWMAGIIELRGKIRFAVSANHCQLVLHLQSQHMRIVERLGELTGTKILYQTEKQIKSSRRLCTEHCDEAHVCVVGTVGPMAVWQISGVGAAIILHNLFPHIVNNTGLMLIVDNICEHLPKGSDLRGRKAVDDTIMRLKKLGWKIPDAALEGFNAPVAVRGPGGKFVKSDELVPA